MKGKVTLMNNGSSNAVRLAETNYHREEKIKCTSYSARRNMLKQRICGMLIIAVVIFAVTFAEDLELVLGLIPVGMFLMLTKKQILEFNNVRK